MPSQISVQAVIPLSFFQVNANVVMVTCSCFFAAGSSTESNIPGATRSAAILTRLQSTPLSTVLDAETGHDPESQIYCMP